MTIRESLLAHRDRVRPAVLAGDASWSWADYLDQAARRANRLRRTFDSARPPHIGVLADNTPEMLFQLAAAGLGGHVIVGLNTTRRGAALAADVATADCQVVLAEPAHLPLLHDLDLSGVTVLDASATDWGEDPSLPDARPEPSTLFMLVFTSGTSGAPKAVRITHEKVTHPGRYLTEKLGLTGEDVCYSSMPLFHSNGVMASWALGVVNGCTLALAERFSASRFLDDVRRYGATYANYVGKPLSYVLATPERHDDADNPLRLAFGNEAGERDTARFAERFGCRVVDGFGSSENAVVVARTLETPPGALGLPQPGIRILDPATGEECPPAVLDEHGRVTNLAEATGEMVNTTGAGQFAGYYNDEAATAERMRDGMYWSGDLAWRDADGFFWFAGRSDDWLRVDGENLSAAPVESILMRHPGIAQVAVYALPDDVGDLLAAAVVRAPGAELTPDGLAAFLESQADLSPKAWPRVVRILENLPRTATNKVLKRELRAAGADGPLVWTRAVRSSAYSPA